MMTAQIIPFPLPLTPPLRTIEGNVDYRQMRAELQRIDQLLIQSGLEQKFIRLSLDGWLARGQFAPGQAPAKAQLNFQIHSRQALRVNVMRIYFQPDFRGFAARLPDSPLFQPFSRLGNLAKLASPAQH